MLLNRGQRLADARPEFTGHLTQGIQHIFFLGGLDHFIVETLSSTAVFRSESQDILVPQSCNGTLEDRRASGTLTDFPRELRSQARDRRLAHHAQGPLDAVLGNNTQERRLFKLHRQTLAQSAIENRIVLPGSPSKSA
jgi:hypothetical protein